VWQSHDPGISTVTDAGVVTAVGNGVAEITATYGNSVDSATVTVDQVADSIELSVTDDVLFVGDTMRAAAVVYDARSNEIVGAPISWSSSVESVVTIDSGGLVTAVAAGWSVISCSAGGGLVAEVEILSVLPPVELGAIGFDMALDTLRNRIYVSLPILNEIAVLSVESYEVVDRVIVGSGPHGVDISSDASRLYVALNGAGAIATLDLDTYLVSEIVIGDSLGSSLAWDVVEALPNRVFATANPYSAGISWVVVIATDLGNAYWRVASNRIIRARPELEKSPDGKALYVGEQFSPNSLYRLDTQDPLAPIVLEDQHGSVYGTDRISVSPDGARIYLRSGQILRSGSFIQAGRISSGFVTEVSRDGQWAFVGRCIDDTFYCSRHVIEVFSTQTFLAVDTLPLFDTEPSRIEVAKDGRGLWVLAADLVSFVDVPDRP